MQHEFYHYFYDAFFGDNKYSVITARRREGKTFHCVLYFYTKLLETSNTKALWVDTTQSNLDKYYDRYWYPIGKGLVSNGSIKYNRQSHILSFHNGSTIDFASAERPENLEGFGYDYIICNEAGIIFKKSSLWDNTIAPMSKNAKKVILIGTPKGKNKFYELARNENKFNDWKWYQINPEKSYEWTPEELQKAKEEYPESVYRQEYCGEFLDIGAGVFKRLENISISEQSKSKTAVLGIDIGRFNDYTYLVGLDIFGNETYSDKFTDLSFEIQKEKIKDAYIYLNYPTVIVDKTGIGLGLFEQLQATIGMQLFGYQITASSKKELINNLQLSIEKGKIHLYTKDIINQLSDYEYEITKAGNYSYNAPDGKHDDAVIALALANSSLFGDSKPTLTRSSPFFVG